MSTTNPNVGESLSEVLTMLESAVIRHECSSGSKPCFTDDGFRAAVKLFMSVAMDKMYDLQESENMSQEDRLNMAQSLGEELRRIIKTYCDVDTHTLYQ